MRVMLLALAVLAAGTVLLAEPAQALPVGVSCHGALGVSLSTDPLGAGVTTPDCTVTLPPLPG